MDGENHGKPVIKMDDLGGPPLFLGWHPYGLTWVAPATFEVFILGDINLTKRKEMIP